MRKHGDTTYFLPGEGIIDPSSDAEVGRVFRSRQPSRSSRSAAPEALAEDVEVAEAEVFEEERAFRFSRLFPSLPSLDTTPEGLIALGEVMEDNLDSVHDHASIPAGYTYLGQFIDHDITHDETGGLPTDTLSVDQIVNGRSPSLDLDSLYGLGPDAESKPLYEDDGMTLRVGMTSPTDFGDANFAAPNDLPRGRGTPGSLIADIGDPRNDENLAVAQTHLAMIKFHNKVLASIPEDSSPPPSPSPQKQSQYKQQSEPPPADDTANGSSRFDQAREIVTRHYQWIVLHDFIKRLVQPDIFDDVMNNGRQFFRPGADDTSELTMPVEFSVGAYRLGHSMVREQYEWNRVFSSNGVFGIATLGDLFAFTSGSLNKPGMQGLPSLPSNWIVDWRRLYDLSPAIPQHPEMNKIRNLDANLSLTLKNLPGFPTDSVPFTSLAVMNLLRSRILSLPSGQSIAAALGATVLTAAEVSEGPHQDIMEQHGFDQETPLWYYVLKEADVMHQGQTLGEVGSRMLMEVFSGLIAGSRTSILRDNWTPTLPSRVAGSFEMADLLLFVDDINPLGDN